MDIPGGVVLVRELFLSVSSAAVKSTRRAREQGRYGGAAFHQPTLWPSTRSPESSRAGMMVAPLQIVVSRRKVGDARRAGLGTRRASDRPVG